MKKTNAGTKNSELFAILETHFKEKINSARIKFITHFIMSLCALLTVNFERLAGNFSADAKKESSLLRIQRFIAGYALDSDIIARSAFNLLPEKIGLTLAIDRTNRKFGQTDINIFMLGGRLSGRGVPLVVFHAFQAGKFQYRRTHRAYRSFYRFVREIKHRMFGRRQGIYRKTSA